MSSAALEALISRLDAAPSNNLLRLAVIRRALADGQDSRALSLAFDLDPDAVSGDDDRKMLAELFRTAGLTDEAAALNSMPTSPADDIPEDIAPAPDSPSNVVPLHHDTAPLACEEERPLTFVDVGGWTR